MGLVLFFLVNASIFSIDGLGEDLSVFRIPFTEIEDKANISFTLRPEFNILNKDGDFRGLFWTNPFNFTLQIPLPKGFIFALGNHERFNQSFDVYFEQDELGMHVVGEGGIEEIYANLNHNFGIGELALRGSYLFGNSQEIWNYNISDYYIADTFVYSYRGKSFCGGINIALFSLSYKCFGNIIMEKENSDTTIDLPEKLSIGLSPNFFGGKIKLLFEHSFWQNGYISPSCFKMGFIKNRFSVNYRFNPWYLDDIQEHGLDFSLTSPIENLGSITINLCCSMRNKGSLREFVVIPELKFTLVEIFGRRK